MAKDYILVLCAHSDDQVIGPGGTLAKLAEEGAEIDVLVFSYGEQSHPWLRKNVTRKVREDESHCAAEVLGIGKTEFLGLREGHFEEDIRKKGVANKLKRRLKRKPSRIYTHSPDDPHPDHAALFRFVDGLAESTDYKGQLLVFDIWTVVHRKETRYPKVVEDISTTFKKKRKALGCFKSQWHALLTLGWSVFYKAWIKGKRNGCTYAEVFYRVR